ncbi:MAG: hypothetical protein ACOX6L_07350 [Syntrophomonadaceae bacterium]|jgi:hypothetical protein
MNSDNFGSMLRQAKEEKEARVSEYENYFYSTSNEELRNVYQHMLLRHQKHMKILHQIEKAILEGSDIAVDILNFK